MIRTFVDASVLIAGARGVSTAAPAADAVLNDLNRSFIASEFLRLEVLPKPLYFKIAREVAYYQAYFAAVQVWVPPDTQLVQLAFQLASTHGMSAIDALHIAAAELGAAEEFITAERPTKPFFRVTTVRVISIQP